MQTWVKAELASADLGDVRREKRLQILVDQLSQNPEGRLNQVCPRSADKKAVYRFFANEHVNPESIREAHQESTWRRIASCARVLIVQDTSNMSCTSHRKVAGVGPLDNAEGRGFLVHSGLAVTETGEPLGVAHQEIWVRSEEGLGQSEQRRERVWQDKESYKWQRTVETVCERQREGQTFFVIGDRESDVYGLLASPRPEGVELLVRSAQNRRVEAEAQYLYTALRQAPVAGKVVVAVSRTGNREPRKATCAVRYQEATLRPPRHGDKGVPKVGVTVWAISVEELHPPKGEGGIRWVLLTTWPVRDFGAAVEAARFYGLRWLVERYHFVLKSGCHVEQSELREQIRLERLQAVYTIIAWRLLAMTYHQARLDPKSACEPTFTPLEWQLLYAFQHHKPYPEAQPPPTIQEAVLWVGKLGGFWGRKGDGPPGVKVIWRGLIRLYGLVDGYRLASLLSPEAKCG